MKNYLSLLVISFLLCSCSNDETKKASIEKESYELTKKELLLKEQKEPATFLNVRGQDKRNLLGQTVVKGVIKNSATVAIFKDVDVQLSFYSKTNALLETDKETIFEEIHPGQSKNFKTKYFAPKGTDSVALEIVGAKAISE